MLQLTAATKLECKYDPANQKYRNQLPVTHLIGVFAELHRRENILDAVGGAVVVVVAAAGQVAIGLARVVHVEDLLLSLERRDHLGVVGVVEQGIVLERLQHLWRGRA